MGFWGKVEKCKHINESSNYLELISCATPYCVGHEIHCLDCGVYISKCDCGCNNGMSGWSNKRWGIYERKIRNPKSQTATNKG